MKDDSVVMKDFEDSMYKINLIIKALRYSIKYGSYNKHI